MVYAKVLSSTYPHARLLRVDASKAEKLPGVVAVLTRDDFDRTKIYFWPGGEGSTESLAIERVRYVGESDRGGGGRGARHRRRGGGFDRSGV